MSSSLRLRQLEFSYPTKVKFTILPGTKPGSSLTYTPSETGVSKAIFDNPTVMRVVRYGFKLRKRVKKKRGYYMPGLHFVDIRSATRTSVGGAAAMRQPYSGYGGCTMSGDICASGAMPALPAGARPDSRIQALVLQRAYGKVSTPEADIGMMLAEGPQTLAMLTSPLRALAKGLKTWCKGVKKRKTRRAALEYASDGWNSVRWGIMPLMSDIDSLRNLFHSKTVRPIFTTKGMDSSVVSVTSLVPGYVPLGWFRVYRQKTIRTEKIHRATCYWQSRWTETSYGGSGFDIPNLLWELIPYSFVVDWFVDVGSWLRSIQPRPHIRYLGNVVSVKELTETIYTVYQVQTSMYGPKYISSEGPACCSDTQAAYLREPNLPVAGRPVISFDPTYAIHAVDGVALAYRPLGKLVGALQNLKWR